MIVEFKEPQTALPPSLQDYGVTLSDNGEVLTYSYDATADATGITKLMLLLNEAGMSLKDVRTTQSSLEDIFVDLVNQGKLDEVEQS